MTCFGQDDMGVHMTLLGGDFKPKLNLQFPSWKQPGSLSDNVDDNEQASTRQESQVRNKPWLYYAFRISGLLATVP